MASTTTTRKPSTRKRATKATEVAPALAEAIQDAPEAPEATPSTDLVPTPPKVDTAALARLNALTDTAQAAIEAGDAADKAAGAAFWAAAEAMREIREGDLVTKSGIVDENGKPMGYIAYAQKHFGRGADYALRYAKAGKVLDRLRAELTPEQQEQFPLPLTESAARPLVTLLAQDNGRNKKIAKAWMKAYEVAAEDETKGGFIPTVIVPSQSHARKAADALRDRKGVNPNTPNVMPASEAEAKAEAKTLAALRKLHAETYSETAWPTFVAIMIEGAAFASKYDVSASTMRQDFANAKQS